MKDLKKENEQKEAQLTSQQQQINALQSELAQIKALLLKQPTTANAEGGAARLWQNEPNPTDGSTVIRYYIPQVAASAQIKVVTANGQEIQSFEIAERGEGQLTLAAGTLASGTYVYRLIVDAKAVASKKLVMTR
jgi:hypothetical protein